MTAKPKPSTAYRHKMAVLTLVDWVFWIVVWAGVVLAALLSP